MALDEDGAALRIYKSDDRKRWDSQLYMRFCTEACEPRANTTTTWPPNTGDRCFVFCSPYRVFFLVADSVEEKKDWLQKLNESRKKHKTENHGHGLAKTYGSVSDTYT